MAPPSEEPTWLIEELSGGFSQGGNPRGPIEIDHAERRRRSEQVEDELQHVGNWLESPEWFERSEVSLDHLEDEEARALHRVRAGVGTFSSGDPDELRELVAERAHDTGEDRALRIGEGSTVRGRLIDLASCRGAIGQERALAERIIRRAASRRLQLSARRFAVSVDDPELFEDLVEARAEASRRELTRDGTLGSISFEGHDLLGLSREAPPGPIHPGVPPVGHFSLLVAPSFSGKTSLAIWMMLARAAGVAPWRGAPEREPGRVLFVSIDEPPSTVARRIMALAEEHPAGRDLPGLLENVRVVGPHPKVDPRRLEALRWTEDGILALERALLEAKSAGRPFSDVVVDAYADMLPPGVTDNDNAEATRIGGHLERIAVHHECAVQILHHAGKGSLGSSRPDPRDVGRGASALAAKARAIFTVEEEPGLSHLRVIRTRTNLAPNPSPLTLEVSERRGGLERRIDFFRPHDPATAWPIEEYLPAVGEEWVSQNELAKRLSGASGKPTSGASRLARTVREIWDGAGLVEVRSGPRGAIECRRLK